MNEPSPADLIDSLSTLAIRITFVATAFSGLGAICTSLKIQSQRSAQNDPGNAVRHKARAARFEWAANGLQYAVIVVAIVGWGVASAKLAHDRESRAQAKADKARLEDGINQERSARLQRSLTQDDIAQFVNELNSPLDTQGSRVEIVVSDSDLEARAFADQLSWVLRDDAHWIVSEECGLTQIPHGVAVVMRPEAQDAGVIRPSSESAAAYAARALVGAVRHVRPDLTFTDPGTWFPLSAERELHACASSIQPDAGPSGGAWIRLIIGSRY